MLYGYLIVNESNELNRGLVVSILTRPSMSISPLINPVFAFKFYSLCGSSSLGNLNENHVQILMCLTDTVESQ